MTDYPAQFLACLPPMLIQECPHPENWSSPSNFSNDPGDPGGKTMCGIIQTEYNFYRHQHNLPARDVRQVTHDEGLDIYFNSYWLPHCPTLPFGLDLSFFDENVNTGPSQAVKVLQVALGIHNDGIWGKETMTAVAAITNPAETVRRFTARRLAVYQMMSGYARFGRDWARRTREIGAEAQKMAAAPVTS